MSVLGLKHAIDAQAEQAAAHLAQLRRASRAVQHEINRRRYERRYARHAVTAAQRRANQVRLNWKRTQATARELKIRDWFADAQNHLKGFPIYLADYCRRMFASPFSNRIEYRGLYASSTRKGPGRRPQPRCTRIKPSGSKFQRRFRHLGRDDE